MDKIKKTVNNIVDNNYEKIDWILNTAFYNLRNKNKDLYSYKKDLISAAWCRLITQMEYIIKKFDLNNESKISVGLRYYIYKLAYHEMLRTLIKNRFAVNSLIFLKDNDFYENRSNVYNDFFSRVENKSKDKIIVTNNMYLDEDRIVLRNEILKLLENFDHVSRLSKNERLFIEVLKEFITYGYYVKQVKNRQTLIDNLSRDNRLKHLARKTLEIYLSRITKNYNNGKI